PEKIVKEYIGNGDTVIDLGCGPGFFSIEMAKMVGTTGKVYCVDLQKEMLEAVKSKAEKNHLTGQMILHNCTQDRIGLDEDIKADFILAYYMLHETPDPYAFAKQIKPLLKENGKFLIVEPYFHVSKSKFKTICEGMTSIGFLFLDTPKNKGGRSLLLTL
ncbi:MAG: class I SAM-dependent methyltransferase, partial [Proteobacteria bacterium]|nr:class I SAM-dependent methyltransferase [Pseudomonadota bacterium]